MALVALARFTATIGQVPAREEKRSRQWVPVPCRKLGHLAKVCSFFFRSLLTKKEVPNLELVV